MEQYVSCGVATVSCSQSGFERAGGWWWGGEDGDDDVDGGDDGGDDDDDDDDDDGGDDDDDDDVAMMYTAHKYTEIHTYVRTYISLDRLDRRWMIGQDRMG